MRLEGENKASAALELGVNSNESFRTSPPNAVYRISCTREAFAQPDCSEVRMIPRLPVPHRVSA
ncbi:MAG TPA: hypothetical protein PKD49_10010 [Hyphomicrobium sp.]|nr:hypothetical protein [Hyphomicrobium sp.]